MNVVHKLIGRLTTRTRREIGTSQRGTAMIEFAIVGPLVVVLAFAGMEYGLLFAQAHDMSDAARRGARMGAATGATAADDYDILRSLQSGTSTPGADKIEKVIVFKAASTDGSAPSQCFDGSVGGMCNVYTGNQITGDRSAISPLETAWPPANRVGGLDFVGVNVTSRHHWVTGMFGASRLVSDTVVMQLEPPDVFDDAVPGRMDSATPPPPASGRSGGGDSPGSSGGGGDYGSDPPGIECGPPTPECPLPDCCPYPGPGGPSGGTPGDSSGGAVTPPVAGGGGSSAGNSGAF